MGSGSGLLPDGTKPLPEPMLPYRQFYPLNVFSCNSVKYMYTVLEIQLKKLQDRRTCKCKKFQVLLGSSRPDKWGPEARVRAP